MSGNTREYAHDEYDYANRDAQGQQPPTSPMEGLNPSFEHSALLGTSSFLHPEAFPAGSGVEGAGTMNPTSMMFPVPGVEHPQESSSLHSAPGSFSGFQGFPFGHPSRSGQLQQDPAASYDSTWEFPTGPQPETSRMMASVPGGSPYGIQPVASSHDNAAAAQTSLLLGVPAFQEPETTLSSKGAPSPHSKSSDGSQASPSPSNTGSRLRTAAQSPRVKVEKPGDTEEIRAQRASHNLIEKNYRNKLNTEFDKLLAVVPGLGSEDRKVSKSEVLEGAKARIRSLEQECETLRTEKELLRRRLEHATCQQFPTAGEPWLQGGGMGRGGGGDGDGDGEAEGEGEGTKPMN